ncbi:hypothetical protein C6Y14_27025 [Streptomyces dioscori]|uniref:Uncharacterized protein n=1 Tax=Streptomyces dioscori TaxID=2109333 RepID=A0A2P8Q2D8_9ACTN|nr:hypothetical protein C6Y14_27025 [Streptomyces dioscori]
MGVRCCALLPGEVRVSADVGELSGLGLLTWAYPSGLVDRVVAACGREDQRRRLLPARRTRLPSAAPATAAATTSPAFPRCGWPV